MVGIPDGKPTKPFFLLFTDHPILQTMDLRTWDKQAQDFVKKHKQRIATS